jgi:hypothetical protein
VFLHPDQREMVGRDFAGPARVSGSVGTGKTVVTAECRADRKAVARFVAAVPRAQGEEDAAERRAGSPFRIAWQHEASEVGTLGSRARFRAFLGPCRPGCRETSSARRQRSANRMNCLVHSHPQLRSTFIRGTDDSMNPEKPLRSTLLVENRIRSLVHCWMSVFDRNNGDATTLLDLLAPTGFELNVSAGHLTRIEEVQGWIEGFSKSVLVSNHRVDSLTFEVQDDTHFAATIRVVWTGVLANGQPASGGSIHQWELVDYGGLFPKITKVTAQLTAG